MLKVVLFFLRIFSRFQINANKRVKWAFSIRQALQSDDVVYCVCIAIVLVYIHLTFYCVQCVQRTLYAIKCKHEYSKFKSQCMLSCTCDTYCRVLLNVRLKKPHKTSAGGLFQQRW